MKILPLLVILIFCGVYTDLSAQTYSASDSIALLGIDLACDASNNLNWNSEPNPGNWTGVTWDTTASPRRAKAIEIPYMSLTGILNASALTELTYLGCYNNSLTGLVVSGMDSLNELNCGSNLLTGLNLQNLTNLQVVGCYDNQLTSLNLTGLSNLGYLNCGDNLISSLDLSDLTKLSDFFCYGNSLTSLDVTSLISLDTLNCKSNLLTSLNLTGLSNLKRLDCMYNQIDTLDLTGLTDLIYVECGFSKISSLNVTGLTNLISLECIGNKLPFSSLLTGLNVSTFEYIPQDTIYKAKSFTSNTNIDYSSEVVVGDSITQFIFYNDSVAVDTNSTGLFTTTGLGRYYCKMTNNKFPGLTLTTAKVTIEAQSPYIYSPTDSLALLAIDAACDSLNTLNWNTEPNPGNWTGIIWDSESPKRVIKILLSDIILKDTMNVSALSELKLLLLMQNNLTGLNVSGLTQLTTLILYYNKSHVSLL